MSQSRPLLLLLACVLLPMPLCAQVLRDTPPAIDAANQVPYRDVRPQPTAQLSAVIKRMQELLRELKNTDLGPAQKQAALEELIRDHDYILRQHNTWLDWQQPQTVDSASLLLEKMIFQIAADVAPTPQSRDQVLENAPQHLELAPKKTEPAGAYEPPLADPVQPPQEQDKAPEPARQTPPPEPPPATKTRPAPTRLEAETEKDGQDSDEKVQVEVLADDQATTAMHDDNTVLREVRDARGGQLFFGPLHAWVGGSVQLDAYVGDGLYNFDSGGGTESKVFTRRAEADLRASVFEQGEIKVQYDFDSNIYRDRYLRWVSKNESHTVTIGNQKEPMGLDYLVGSKFTTALEASAPASAFGSFRSRGIRYNGTTTLQSQHNPLRIWGDSPTHVTGSIGLFGEDIENSNHTDWAVTGRLTAGGNNTLDTAVHLGVSASYRHGEYDNIASRPGLTSVSKIQLAAPAADTRAMAALEFVFTQGSLHSQAELYYSDYSGGEVDASGWGAYGQLGWLFGGRQRSYNPRWGVWAPIGGTREQVFEVFGRLSLTHGDDELSSSNALGLLTLGGNWYYRQFRLSANILLADSKRDIAGESDGHSLAVRLQYIF